MLIDFSGWVQPNYYICHDSGLWLGSECSLHSLFLRISKIVVVPFKMLHILRNLKQELESNINKSCILS
jgi:hypothetical protein